MKKLILLFALIWSAMSFGQFTIDKENGLSDYVVTEVPEKPASEIYKKTKDWIQRIYKNPNYVTKGEIDGEYIRWEGVESDFFCQNKNNSFLFYCHKLKYTIEISFKDGKYKFDVINIQLYNPSPYIGWYNVDLKGSTYYKNNGEIRPTYKNLITDMPIFFNNMNESLKKYIEGEEKNTDNW